MARYCSVFCFSAICLMFIFRAVDGFIPTKIIGWVSPSSKTHQDIMEEALTQVANDLMKRYPEQYSNPAKTLRSRTFKNARKQFLDAVAKPDDKEKDVIEAHFDNESFADAVDRLMTFRQSLINGIKSSSMESARDLAGRALHGLQDFYSHSNWIEMGNTGPYVKLGQQRIPASDIANEDQATCVDCRNSAGEISSSGVCERNIIKSLNDDKLLTTGYFSPEPPDCGKSTVKPLTLIVGGVEATAHSWPWQCRLVVWGLPPNETWCGASVVNKYYLLTAAHCIFDRTGVRLADAIFTVYCGDHNTNVLESSEQRFSAPVITVHPDYNPSEEPNDIAVIKLPTPLLLDEYIKPVCLPTKDVSVGTTCVVTGWGETQGTGRNNVLRQVSLDVISQSKCVNAYASGLVISSMLCAGIPAGGRDSCTGDSGGPLVCKVGGRYELHGIVSFGPPGGCAQPDIPGVYTRVTSFLSWIEQNTGAKCRHGGNFDKGKDSVPVGGINKDSASSLWSPHSNLHQQAAKAAMESTVEFLESVRLAVVSDAFAIFPDELFAEFIGIPVGSSKTLCFVIDTTGSMADEIAAVRDYTIRITREASVAEDSTKPSDYVLVPFNDPDYGPLTKTTNASEMIDALSALTATGGGDEPELAFHGLQLAVDSVRDGSTCYMFTDASAKDAYMYPVVMSQCLKKHIRIDIVLTSWGYKRRKRSTGQQGNTRAATTYSYYNDLTLTTGGTLFNVNKGDIGSAMDVVNSGAASDLNVVVFTADNVVGDFSFYVDQTMTGVFVRLSSSYNSLVNATFTHSNGTQYMDYRTEMDLSSLKLYNMTNLQTGLWTASVFTQNDYPFSVRVTASSIVSFTYQIAASGSGSHPGYFVLTGNPIAGTEYFLVVDVLGAFDDVIDAPTDKLSNISAVLIMSSNGSVTNRLHASELSFFKQYVVTSVLPSTGFRLAIEGVDAEGNIFRRFDESTISAVVIRLDIKIVGNGSYSLYPGESVNVSVDVTSIGVTATWYIRVSDTAGYYQGATPITVPLDTNQTTTIYLQFGSPMNDSCVGTVSTATVSAGTSSESSVENFQIFYLNVKSSLLDYDPPSCAITVVDGLCTGDRPTSETDECRQTVWTASFNVRDVGSGLQSVSVKPLLGTHNYSLHVEPFSASSTVTVNGTYTASCCSPNVTINVLDVYGNIGDCFVYNDVTPPTCTSTVTVNNCKPYYNSSNVADAVCWNDTWQSSLNVQDTGSGLKQLTVSTDSTDYTLDPATVLAGSIVSTRVTYRSSCCYQTADITVQDVSNNLATCRVAVTETATPPPVPPRTSFSNSDSARLSAASAAAACIALFIVIAVYMQ